MFDFTFYTYNYLTFLLWYKHDLLTIKLSSWKISFADSFNLSGENFGFNCPRPLCDSQ